MTTARGTTPQAGERHHMLTCTGELRKTRGHVEWQFKCDCGAVTFKDIRVVRRGYTKSCGCMRGRKFDTSPRRMRERKPPFIWTVAARNQLRALAEADTPISEIAKTIGAQYNETLAQMRADDLPINWVRNTPSKACWPAGLLFEDMPLAVVRAERYGRVPKPSERQSGMSSALGWM